MFGVGGARRFAAMAAACLVAAGPAHAYLFWTPPALTGAPATADDPKITQPLLKATATEQKAGLVWTMRAGLNVAALQCQFAPALQTVANYNNMLRQHAAELQTSYNALQGYFKRTAGKTWQTALDQYTTRTYNSFSTLNAQIIFCDTAASIGRETLQRPRGELAQIATTRLREFRNSLSPVNDAAFVYNARVDQTPEVELTEQCFDRKGRPAKCKS